MWIYVGGLREKSELCSQRLTYCWYGTYACGRVTHHKTDSSTNVDATPSYEDIWTLLMTSLTLSSTGMHPTASKLDFLRLQTLDKTGLRRLTWFIFGQMYYIHSVHNKHSRWAISVKIIPSVYDVISISVFGILNSTIDSAHLKMDTLSRLLENQTEWHYVSRLFRRYCIHPAI